MVSTETKKSILNYLLNDEAILREAINECTEFDDFDITLDVNELIELLDIDLDLQITFKVKKEV